MGLRFRKSVKVAPGVKVNLNKKSSSVTFGTKGVHHTVSSSGKKTTSVGVPGTGLNYVSTSSGKQRKSKNSHSKAESYADREESSNTLPKKILSCFTCLLLGVLCVFLLFIALALIVGSSSELTGIDVVWTATEYSINESTEVVISPVPDSADIDSLTLSENSIASLEYKDGKAIVTFNAAGSEELYFIADNDINSTPQLINVLNQDANADEAAAQTEAERIAAEQAAQAEAERIAAEQAAQAEAERIAAEQAASQAQQQSQERMVWVSATGSKYHRKPDCGKMNPDTAAQIPLSQAESQGYSACSKCY